MRRAWFWHVASHLFIEPEYLLTPLVIIGPSKIVEKVKGEDRAKKEQSEHVEHCNNVTNKDLDDNQNSEKISKAKCYSQYSLAKSVIENNLISQYVRHSLW